MAGSAMNKRLRKKKRRGEFFVRRREASVTSADQGVTFAKCQALTGILRTHVGDLEDAWH